MIDIHSHIIPGVDDGACTYEESYSLINALANIGFANIFATPHYIDRALSSHPEKIRDSINMLNTKFKEASISVHPGMEILANQDIHWMIANNRIQSLGNSKYILIELPMTDYPVFFEEMCFNLQIKGYKIILAHPERNIKIIENPSLLEELVEHGIYAQLNLPSLSGLYGNETAEVSMDFLKRNVYHFLGSDIHSLKTIEYIEKGIELAKNAISEEVFSKISVINPMSILSNSEICIDDIIYPQKKNEKNFFSRLFKKNRFYK
jgi:protein-tyrosine phosphatase